MKDLPDVLFGLRQRLAALELTLRDESDQSLARALRNDLAVVAAYANDPVLARIVEVTIESVLTLEGLERAPRRRRSRGRPFRPHVDYASAQAALERCRTQAQAARELGVSQSTLSRVYARKRPS